MKRSESAVIEARRPNKGMHRSARSELHKLRQPPRAPGDASR
jgi:hypothetical protein